MVAVIKVSGSIHRIFNYNENKVREGVAECIGAGNYPLDPGEMNAKIKLSFLLKRIALNENVKRNSVHISLNFDPSESLLTSEKLSTIAGVYMQKLGFGDQPYLIYQHHDAAHPHIHIVTTNICSQGSRIDMHYLGIRKSEPARKEIEKMFGLVVADDRKRQQAFQLTPVSAAKVRYGRSATKRAITNVLDAVLEKYRFATLPELNTVLSLYNVRADRGSENSRIYQGGGLVYRILDEQGNQVGVPIKASDFYNKPTLKYLEARFAVNQVTRYSHKVRVKNAIDLALKGRQVTSTDQLVAALERQGISAVLRGNEAGLIYGITYVDHKTHCVFNGSALGKAYSAKAIRERCDTSPGVSQQRITPAGQTETVAMTSFVQNQAPDVSSYVDIFKRPYEPRAQQGVEHSLFQSPPAPDYVPAAFKRKRKRRKRKSNQ